MVHKHPAYLSFQPQVHMLLYDKSVLNVLQVPSSPQEQQAQLNRVIATAFVHNVAQWYDAFAFLSLGHALAAAFFPGETASQQLLSLYGIFFAGFVLRPVGAAVFPSVAANWGRRFATGWAIALSAVPTALMGVMPTYAQVRECVSGGWFKHAWLKQFS